MKKKSLVLKIAALCIASAGFMFAKSSMPSVQVYAMDGVEEKLMEDLNNTLDAFGAREDFYATNALWIGNDVNAIDEIENLLDGEYADIDVIRDGVKAFNAFLDNFSCEAIQKLTRSWWGYLLLKQIGREDAVIEDQELRCMLRGLYNRLVVLGILHEDDESAIFRPVMQ